MEVLVGQRLVRRVLVHGTTARPCGHDPGLTESSLIAGIEVAASFGSWPSSPLWCISLWPKATKSKHKHALDIPPPFLPPWMLLSTDAQRLLEVHLGTSIRRSLLLPPLPVPHQFQNIKSCRILPSFMSVEKLCLRSLLMLMYFQEQDFRASSFLLW